MIDTTSKVREIYLRDKDIISEFLSSDKTPLFILYYLKSKGATAIRDLTYAVGLGHETSEKYLEKLNGLQWIRLVDGVAVISEEGERVLVRLNIVPDAEDFLDCESPGTVQALERAWRSRGNWIDRVLVLSFKSRARERLLRRCLVALLNPHSPYDIDEVVEGWKEVEIFSIKFSDRELIALYQTVKDLELDSKFLDLLRGWDKKSFDYFKREIRFVREDAILAGKVAKSWERKLRMQPRANTSLCKLFESG